MGVGHARVHRRGDVVAVQRAQHRVRAVESLQAREIVGDRDGPVPVAEVGHAPVPRGPRRRTPPPHRPPANTARPAAEDAAPSFHARFSATGRRYRYTILNRPVRPAFARWTALHVPRPLDEAAMREGSRRLVGTHDFSSFACNPGEEEDPIVTVREASVERRGEIVVIELEAVSFLYKMVRTIAGTLVAVGKGTIPPAEISAILAARDRKAAFPTAPAWGLALVGVSYP